MDLLRIADLQPEQLDALQLVHNHSQIQAVLDNSILSDLDTYQALHYLVKNGYVVEE